MTEQEEIINTIKVLRKEVDILTKRTRDRGTGHLHTAIGVITSRIDELMREVTAPYFNEEDIYDGYKQHTEAMEQARLHGHLPKDDVKHSPCYYDTQRNRPMTVSEQMQEELEPLPDPLPINTFK